MKKYQHLFGPLISRRFGLSLGVDLCPMKTCSYDCIFCQLGTTSNLTTKRKEFFPTAEITDEIDCWLEEKGKADYITLAGSGEPTLYSRLDEIIDFIHSKTDIPVLVLTNGSLLWDPEVRKAVGKADVVKISMSAWNQNLFEHINRPEPKITFQKMIDGEITFSKEYQGKLVLEVFLLAGVNAIEADIKQIVNWTNKIQPDTIHLNTVIRPVSGYFDYTVQNEKLASFAAMFTPKAEIPQETSESPVINKECDEVKILDLIRRRPLTLEQISKTFGIHPNETAKITGKLLRNKQIIMDDSKGNKYFKIHLQENNNK